MDIWQLRLHYINRYLRATDDMPRLEFLIFCILHAKFTVAVKIDLAMLMDESRFIRTTALMHLNFVYQSILRVEMNGAQSIDIVIMRETYYDIE